MIFCDVGRHTDTGQNASLAGTLIGDLKKDSVFHLTFSSSHKAKRPVVSIGFDKGFAADEGSDVGNIIVDAY